MTEQTCRPHETRRREALTDDQLLTALGDLAYVAHGDPNHDFATVVDLYQEGERLARWPGLSGAQAEYLAQVVRASLPQASAGSGVWRGENVLCINERLARTRPRGFGTEQAARRVLPDLLNAAVRFVEAGRHRPGAGADGPGPAAAGAAHRIASGEGREP